MFAFELTVLLILGGAAALASLIHTARALFPQVAAIRRALRECPAQLELRFAVVDTIVSYNDGKVVPLRQRKTISLPRPLTARVAA